MKTVPHLPNCRCGSYERDLTPEDDWYINAPDHYNCFWNYIRHNDRPHGLKEIAQALGLSISAITTIERKALEKMMKRMKAKGITLEKN